MGGGELSAGGEIRVGHLDARRAALLGLVQGPAELLPVSSSGHLTLIPWLAGWAWRDGDPEVRKAFEVAVHAGSAAGLLIGQRRLIRDELRRLDHRRAAVIGLSFLPAAIVGYALERPIERRLGGPATTAGGLLAGSVAMALADRTPQVRGPGDARALDGVALGIAQASALVPGVSRNGATLAAARWRRFTREHANLLSRTVALPVIAGAAVLKAERLRRRGVDPAFRGPLAAGTIASFASTLASQRLISLVERDRALWPYAAYRAVLAVTVLARWWRGRQPAAAPPGRPAAARDAPESEETARSPIAPGRDAVRPGRLRAEPPPVTAAGDGRPVSAAQDGRARRARTGMMKGDGAR